MVKFFLTHKLREHFEAISRRLPRPLTKAETDMLGDGAAALARGLKPVDLMDKSDPLEIRKTLEGSSVLILHGDKDKVIHASATRRFHRELTAAGVLSEHRIIELGEGLEHDLFEVSSPKTFPIAHDFFVRSFSGSKNLKQLRRFFNWDIFRRKADVATGESAG